MKLLTDGAQNDPVLGFCLRVVSSHARNWPPTEDVLAEQFVDWLGVDSLVTRDGLTELCRARGVRLSFSSLPQEIRGVNCSFLNEREIVIAEHEAAPFSDTHTLFHEFREMLEQLFRELAHPTLGPNDSLEVRAEHFAAVCRMKIMARELPAFLERAQNNERKGARYLGYAFVGIFTLAYCFSCIYMRQLEEIGSEFHL